MSAATLSEGPSRHWLKRCITGETGQPLPVVANAIEALRSDPAIQDAFAYDEMARVPIIMHGIGDPFGAGNYFEPRPMTDNDVVDVQKWMQLAGIKRIS